MVVLSWSVWTAQAQKQTFTALPAGTDYDYSVQELQPEAQQAFKMPFFEDSENDNFLYRSDDWKGGYAPFGFGTPGVRTVIPYGEDSTNKRITYYFFSDEMNSNFNGVDVDSLYLYVNYDDAFVAYINGTEVARSNMTTPAGPVISSMTANTEHQHRGFERFDISRLKSVMIAGSNQFAIEVHGRGGSDPATFMDAKIEYIVSGAANIVPTVSRGPYQHMAGPNSIVIRWRTTMKTPTMLSYGARPGVTEQTIEDTALVTDHIVHINGLEPSTKYYYQIGGGLTDYQNLIGAQYFSTAPPVGQAGPTRIWVTGDFGDFSPNQVEVKTQYETLYADKLADLWVWLGDNVYSDGTEYEYDRNMFLVYKEVFPNHMVIPTPGNHDLGAADALNNKGPYFKAFSMPKNAELGGVPSGTQAYYSYDYANIHFISLESTQIDRSPNGVMAQWLKADLAQNRQRWTIAMWHHPSYSKGSHDSDVERNLMEMRQYINPILEEGGVDLVMNGHSHSYERSYFMDSYYGLSSDFDPAKHCPQGTGLGDPEMGGPYIKDVTAGKAHKGTVYMVAGSSGSFNPEEPLNHPALVKSLPDAGSVILDINGDTLTSTFLCVSSMNTDHWQMIKKGGEVTQVKQVAKKELQARVFPNPTDGIVNVEMNVPSTSTYTLKVLAMDGKEVYSKVTSKPSTTINLTGLAKGAYVVTITNGTEQLSREVMYK